MCGQPGFLLLIKKIQYTAGHLKDDAMMAVADRVVEIMRQ